MLYSSKRDDQKLCTCHRRNYVALSTQITGDSVYSKLKWEAGVHRVQRVPATEAAGRVHTSTATVAIMPEVSRVRMC